MQRFTPCLTKKIIKLYVNAISQMEGSKPLIYNDEGVR